MSTVATFPHPPSKFYSLIKYSAQKINIIIIQDLMNNCAQMHGILTTVKKMNISFSPRSFSCPKYFIFPNIYTIPTLIQQFLSFVTVQIFLCFMRGVSGIYMRLSFSHVLKIIFVLTYINILLLFIVGPHFTLLIDYDNFKHLLLKILFD